MLLSLPLRRCAHRIFYADRSTAVNRSSGWKQDSKFGALQRFALHRQLGTVRLGDPPRDGQAQAAACLLLSFPQIRLVEALEDMPPHSLGHSDAGIANGQKDAGRG